MSSRRQNTITTNLDVLYQEMADLTRPKCAACRVPLSCCDAFYCELARENSEAVGVKIQPTGHPTLPYMGPTGCIVPPHLRPLCTLHVCSINSLGCDPKDPIFTKTYFSLRGRIEKAAADLRAARKALKLKPEEKTT